MQFTQCNSLSNNRTLRFEDSARHEALSNMLTRILGSGGARSKVSLFANVKKFTFEQRTKRGLVELIGIEPMTPCLQSRCSPS
jgi:hypothetical protein